MIGAALRLCIACLHQLIVNCSSTLFPMSNFVATMKLITLEVSSFKRMPLQLFGSLLLHFHFYSTVRMMVCHTL
jgi:hypothetical protein